MAFGGNLKQSTAVDILVGPFLDEDDGKTAETALTITQAEIRLSKNSANMAQKNEATSLVHDELGYYVCKLNATDTNTIGLLTVTIHESGALPVRHEYQVVAEIIHEWHVAKTGNDSNSGHSFEDAFLTTAQAVSSAADGDEIKIWPGDYGIAALPAKKLNLVGTNRATSVIAVASGNAIVMYHNCTIKNLSTTVADGGLSGVKCEAKDNIAIIDCDIAGAKIGLLLYGAAGKYKDAIIRGCRFFGKQYGADLKIASHLIADSNIFTTDGSYDGAALSSGAVIGGSAIYTNCTFEALRLIESSFSTRGVEVIGGSRLVFQNCYFRGQQQDAASTGAAYGLHVNYYLAHVVCLNCVFKAKNSGSGEEYDIKVSNGSLTLLNCHYETSSGTINQVNTGWAAAVQTEVEEGLVAKFTQAVINNLESYFKRF